MYCYCRKVQYGTVGGPVATHTRDINVSEAMYLYVGRKEGRKEGREVGKKEGRQEGRQAGRKEKGGAKEGKGR